MADAALDGLSRFNLIVGPNNAGKSSVLEAAALLMRPFDPGQWVQTARARDETADLVDSLWSMFPSSNGLHLEDGPVEASLEITGTIDGRSRSLQAHATAREVWGRAEEESELDDLEVGEPRDEGPERAEPELTIAVELGGQWAHAQHELRFRRRGKTAPKRVDGTWRAYAVTTSTHRSTHRLAGLLAGAVDHGQKALAVEMMRAFDPGVQSLDLSETRGKPAIRVTHDKRGVVDIASFGDGLRRAAAFALALTHASGGLLLIDEVESGIHSRALADAMAKLLASAQKAGVQILATTHSLEAIDAVVRAAEQTGIDELTVHHLKRDGAAYRVRRYDGARAVMLREGGLDLR